MAKKEQAEGIGEVKLSDIAGTEPGEIPAPARITTIEQARQLVKTNYSVPDGCLVVYVTEDRNVFWQENASSADNHAQRNNLKLFRLDEWTK
jgi:hypothetical protein